VTLEALLAEHPGAELFFILGEDALADLPHWHAPGRIVELATLAVARRTSEEVAGRGGEGLPGMEARLVWLEMPAIGISASEIRERVRGGRSVRYWLPAAVEEYITRHGLYR
jgi:nicotinate-nucleotide adenylyltransferase